METKQTGKILFITLIIIAVSLEIISDVLFKKRALENKNMFFIIGMIIYIIGTFLRAYSLKHEALSKAICIFTIVNLIAGVLVGMLYFNETLTLTNKIGIGLGLISVLLIEL